MKLEASAREEKLMGKKGGREAKPEITALRPKEKPKGKELRSLRRRAEHFGKENGHHESGVLF